MEIIKSSPDLEYDRMYCPSTDEIIFETGRVVVNEDADAFIGYWLGGVLESPSIADDKLKSDWNEYWERRHELKNGNDEWSVVESFLKNYDNPSWIVHECTFEGGNNGPVYTTVYYVVMKDTIIEDDPNYNEDNYDEYLSGAYDLNPDIVKDGDKCGLKSVSG